VRIANSLLKMNSQLMNETASSSTMTSLTTRLALADLELVISHNMFDRTAVLWALEGPPEQVVEAAMNPVLDGGLLMREGLNVARLYYDREDRWWKWGEKTMDPTGAFVASSAPAWDGCVVAFSGQQRFHLEFRLQGRGEAVLLLHERHAAYAEQSCATEPAMELARVLMNLREATGASYCAFPVADPWLVDEDWKSVLRTPLYPDFFLLPEAGAPQSAPEPFRAIPLIGKRVMWTVLPVKAAPIDPPVKRDEHELVSAERFAVRREHRLRRDVEPQATCTGRVQQRELLAKGVHQVRSRAAVVRAALSVARHADHEVLVERTAQPVRRSRHARVRKVGALPENLVRVA
jgi:hypothetical protein